MQCYHLVPIEWESSYSFGVNSSRRDALFPSAYSEYLELEITSRLVHPLIENDGASVTLRLLGSRVLEQEIVSVDIETRTPSGVGMLTLRGQRREYLGSLSQDALLHILDRLELSKIKHIMMHGDDLRYGKAQIRYISFKETVDLEDWY